MIFTFDTLPIENKEVLCQSILERFDRDIRTVSCAFSSRNYAFIFSEGCFPAIVRVGVETPHHNAEDVLCELMWIDDLKNDVSNVCQPVPSLGNRLVERITIGETVFLATMFRKANGATLPESKWNRNYFYNVGALLGKIHRTSSEGYQLGFRYKRKHWYESPYYDFSCYDENFQPSARKNAEAILQKIKTIPQDPQWYGMIHGDFQNGNLFCDWGDLWAFDFDDCCYGFYMFDIACMAHVCIHSRVYAEAHPSFNAHDRLLAEDGILTQIRKGYSTEYQLPEEQWALFDDFFRLRVAQALCISSLHKSYPKDILIALYEPMLAYLKDDKPPVDRMEEVKMDSVGRLTPEQHRELTKIVMGN